MIHKLGKGVTLLKNFPDLGLYALLKPAGILSHPNSIRDINKSLIKEPYCIKTESYKSNRCESDGKLWLLHRLDSATSGIILVSSNELISNEIKKMFRLRLIFKKYLAVIFGRLPRHSDIIWRDSMHIKRTAEGKLRADGKRDFSKVSNKPNIAETIVEEKLYNKKKNLSKIELAPCTGYTHQLRYQCSLHGYPIIGDKTYGNFGLNRTVRVLDGKPKKLYLHSSELSFQIFGEEISLNSRPDESFDAILE